MGLEKCRMKTTDREHSELLVKAGWVKETYWKYRYTGFVGKFFLAAAIEVSNINSVNLLPAPTADEIGEELSFEDMLYYYWELPRTVKLYPSGAFTEWLYATRNDPNAMAEVWCWKMKGGELWGRTR